jgi:phage tail sheath protein FI
MPEYLSPGVYVEEIDTGNKPIEGVSTSTAGMLGVTERGPVNVPILITSYGEYRRWFGERLPHDDFFDAASGPHCYLPQAVEGFFQNEGQRVFVTRVLDGDGAAHASNQLFDRGAIGAPGTVLLRTVSEQTGTEAALPRLYVLDRSGLAHNTWIRVGDGSAAEYRQVDVVVPLASNTHVPLDSSLSRAHDVGATVEEFARAVDGAFVGPITLVTPLNPQGQHLPVLPRDQTITVTSATPGDIAALLGAANQLLEIGAAPTREFRFIDLPPTQTAPDQVTLHLDSPLTLTYQNGNAVTPLQIIPATPAVQATALETAAGAGDSIIFVNNRGGNFVNRPDLVIIDRANNAVREVRRVGALTTLAIPTGAYQNYTANSLVERITLQDDRRNITGVVAAGATSVNINDITLLSLGQNVLVGPLIGAELRVIQTIIPGVAPAGTVGFTAAMTNPHGPGEFFRPAAKSTTSAATAGQSVLSLDDRLSLSPRDILRVDTGAAQEFVQIEAIPNRAPAGSAPDLGIVVLTSPFNEAHPAGTHVWRDVASAPAVPIEPAVLALDAQIGATALQVTDGFNFAAGDSIRVTTPDGSVFFHQVSAVTPVANATEISVQAPPLERAHRVGAVVIGRDPLIEVEAIDPGAWGNRLRISVEDEAPGLVSRTQLATKIDDTHIRLASVAGVEAGTVLELLFPDSDTVIDPANPLKVIAIDRTTNFTLILAGTGLSAPQNAALAAAGPKRLGVRSREFHITVLLMHHTDPSLPSRSELVMDTEVFRNVSMDPRHSRYFQTIIGEIDGPPRKEDRRPEGDSWYVRVHDLAQDLVEPNKTNTLESIRLGPEPLRDILPSGQTRPARRALEHGDDSIGTITDDTYIGLPDINPEARSGLYSFTTVDEISIVSIPGRTGPAIQGALIDHCELDRYRFAVLDGPIPHEVWSNSNDSLTDVQFQRQQFDTKYAALYHPWLLIEDPFPVNPAKISNYPIPPSGHVLGVYARTDVERGVHKAPANEVVRGILGLQRLINKQEQDILNPSPVNINVIRDFRNNERGIRVWGGRVITSDTDWKYVNVRRLLIFIEKSIDRGLQWVVFEPNAEPLWARVRRTIGNFLTTVWRNGGLEGTKPEEAYFVKCDRTTMTQTDIDNGKLIVVIGVAPVKPAEFVIIRIGLWTAHAES